MAESKGVGAINWTCKRTQSNHRTAQTILNFIMLLSFSAVALAFGCLILTPAQLWRSGRHIIVPAGVPLLPCLCSLPPTLNINSPSTRRVAIWDCSPSSLSSRMLLLLAWLHASHHRSVDPHLSLEVSRPHLPQCAPAVSLVLLEGEESSSRSVKPKLKCDLGL